MVGQTALAVGALVVLAQSKAIVTNNCAHDVFVWSVVEAKNYAENLPIKPGKHYVEPFHFGTATNPGVAIKVSSHRNGINDGEDEIDFAYAVDQTDPSKIWVNLSNVRGSAFEDDVTLLTCHGPFKGPSVSTLLCSEQDDIELVLCGSESFKASHQAFANASDSHRHRDPKKIEVLHRQREPQTSGARRLTNSQRGGSPDTPWNARPRNSTTKQASDGELESRGHGKSKWTYSQACLALGKLSGRTNTTLFPYGYECDDIINDIRAKQPGKKKPKVNIGWYADNRFPGAGRTKLQSAFDKYWSEINWSDSSGSASDYGWFRPNNTLRARKSTRSYKETCDLLLAMFGGTDCEKRATELKAAAQKRHPSKSDPEVHFGNRFSITGIDDSHKEREALESDLKRFLPSNDWTSSSGSGTPYGDGHETRVLAARRTPKVSRKVACNWLPRMFEDISDHDCNAIVNRFLQVKKVYLGDAVKEHLPGMRPKDVKKNLKTYFPAINWTDDDHA